jgi:hypothetical protein
MATEFLVNNAELKCDKGTTSSQLTVNPTITVMYKNKKAATISDKTPNVNIMPFGTCSLKPASSNTCIPLTATWSNFKNDVFHEGKNALTINSCITYTAGGIIKPTNSGQ